MTTTKAEEAIKAITDSLPPVADPITYLTIVEKYMSPEILPTLNNILQDAQLTQNIGWDLIHVLLPVSGAEECLTTIARLGNPREVVLKVTESLQMTGAEEELVGPSSSKDDVSGEDRYCLLVNLLAILLPRIQTKYPSRFLSTTLIAVLSTFPPRSNQATLAVLSFVHTISGKKRPSLPGRKSSLQIPKAPIGDAHTAPDPEAQDTEPNEAAIQNKLLQSFVTHILEEYVNYNSLEWAARLQESFDPKRVVTGRPSVGEDFREEPVLVTRDIIAGQLIVSKTLSLLLLNSESRILISLCRNKGTMPRGMLHAIEIVAQFLQHVRNILGSGVF
jgi:hypothetical protein